MNLLDLSATVGLCALVVLIINVLLGMLLSTAYKIHPLWKKLPALLKKVSILWRHSWMAYPALILVLLHPALLICDGRPPSGFKIERVKIKFRSFLLAM